MGRPGEKLPGLAPLGRKRSWPAALLGASILSSCFLLTQAQGWSTTIIPVTWNPQNPIEGQNVTLRPRGILENVASCSWYRGRVTDVGKRIFQYYQPPLTVGQINGPAHTGRETAGPDCSLLIWNLTSADSGDYTVREEGAVTATGFANIEVSEDISNHHAELYICAYRDRASGEASNPRKPTVTPPDQLGKYITSPWIIVGFLAVILALSGALLYFFFCPRRRRDRISRQTQTALQFYENVSPSGQVNPEKSSAVNNIYQTLEPGSQAVYEELRDPTPKLLTTAADSRL